MTKAEEKLVKEVVDDFKRRAQERKSFDLIWQINMNFLMGNQYCNVGYGGNLEEQDRQFFWQQREVFNHIAPIYDIRYAKLSKIKPDINIIPATNDERDKQAAKVSKKIIQSVRNRLEIDEKINQAIKWSEVCGTVFYKIGWNGNAGQVLGQDENGVPIRSGEVDFSVVSPFEIYPDSSVCERIEDCQSIIHAKAYSVEQVKNMYGINVKGQNVNTYSLDGVSVGVGGLGFNGTVSKIVESVKDNSVIVIEKYEKESEAYPFGRLTIVAGDQLVYDGELPFAVGTDGKRDFPFIKQTSIIEPGSFWGTSVIERLVPVQRAYNAVKNRKHEFINRLSLGVLSVEDGSVDLDNLEEEGLCPGKVLVYRQGAVEPKYLQGESLPNGIEKEEEFLIDEFKNISGVSDLLSANGLTSSMSGIAMELMISQDETRLNASVESIKHATKAIAQKILKLYKQYAIVPRLERIVGENGEIEMFYFTSSDISSDDIIIENQTDDLQSLAKRRELVLELLDRGVLNDERGNLSNKMKSKVIEMLGMGVWESAQDVGELHIKKAGNENLKILNGQDVKAIEIDNHSLHINEHIAFMLGQDFEDKCARDETLEERFLKHINQHKKMEE
ncbi:MAG: hypothetical protein IJY90_00715 [Clostridia bacterium]|nr:hypothetical protein [Clostridia bacterium]